MAGTTGNRFVCRIPNCTRYPRGYTTRSSSISRPHRSLPIRRKKQRPCMQSNLPQLVRALRMSHKASSTTIIFISLAGCHPWFSVGSGAPAAQQPESTKPPQQSYELSTPSWVPLIDACLASGGKRNECLESLPPEELEKLRAWEQRNAVLMRPGTSCPKNLHEYLW